MLRFNPTTGAWLLYATAPEMLAAAGEIGMDRSQPASAKAGCPVYYTHSEYAALPLWRWADDDARDRLFVRRLEYQASKTTERPRPHACPSDKEFMPLQDAAIDYVLSRPHSVVGDEVGVGKTPTAIGVANEMQAERVLVVCPANIRLQWQRQVMEWSTLRKLYANVIASSRAGPHPAAQYTIISYDLLRNAELFRILLEQRYDLLIADEIHYCKEIDAQRSVRLFGDLSGNRPGVAHRAERVLGLTGTFLPNRPRECYLASRHLCWDAIDWQSEEQFQYTYNPSAKIYVPAKGGRGFGSFRTEEKRGRLPELRARLRCNFLVRRTKRDPEVRRQLAVTLPQYELTYVEPNGAIRKALKAESMLDIDIDRLDELDFSERGHIAAVRREMGIAKAPRVVEHINMLLDSGLEKVTVFAHHRDVVSYLADKLAGGVKIWGGTTALQKQRIVDRFITDPGFPVLVGQMQACGTGTDGLQQVCRWMVLPEPSWTPGDNEQIAGRIGARMGQRHDATIQFLVAPGSLDERILGEALRKMHVVHHAMDGSD